MEAGYNKYELPDYFVKSTNYLGHLIGKSYLKFCAVETIAGGLWSGLGMHHETGNN